MDDSDSRGCATVEWEKGSTFSLNCTSVSGEPINDHLKDHALHAEWQYRDFLRVLHTWADTLIQEFNLGLQLPAIQVERIGIRRLGTYRYGRNGLGLQHEITLNAIHLDRPLAGVLTTLFHELLHEWQALFGKPGLTKYHNREFRQKAAFYGLIIDTRGYTVVEAGRFTTLLGKHGVESKSLPSPKEARTPKLHGRSKMQKYRCGCTTVRCAVDLNARCNKCDLDFEEAPPAW